MRYLFFILFLSSYLLSYSQHEFEVCEYEKVFTYSTSMDVSGTISWFLNGNLIDEGNSVDIVFSQAGQFQLVAIGYNDIGCESVPEVMEVVVTECDPLIYWVPNSFTPDGNEFNQSWGPILTSGIALENFELFIYNRWGDVIWESHDATAKWDGTFNGELVQDGVYVWTMLIDMKETDGMKLVTGHVTILR